MVLVSWLSIVISVSIMVKSVVISVSIMVKSVVMVKVKSVKVMCSHAFYNGR